MAKKAREEVLVKDINSLEEVRCTNCKERIYENMFVINDEVLCNRCMREKYLVKVKDLGTDNTGKN